MGKPLGVLAAFVEGLDLVPRHLHSGSQPFIAPVPKVQHSSDLLGHQACTWSMDIHVGKHSYTQNKPEKRSNWIL